MSGARQSHATDAAPGASATAGTSGVKYHGNTTGPNASGAASAVCTPAIQRPRRASQTDATSIPVMPPRLASDATPRPSDASSAAHTGDPKLHARNGTARLPIGTSPSARLAA